MSSMRVCTYINGNVKYGSQYIYTYKFHLIWLIPSINMVPSQDRVIVYTFFDNNNVVSKLLK